MIKYRRYPVIVCLAAILLLTTFSYSQPAKVKHIQKENKKQTGIVFTESSWNNSVKKAAETHKYIFVDAYASWCGPCRLLKSTTFQDAATAAFFNQHFINLSIDMEKGEGPDLASHWEIESYPTLLIFDSAGKPVLVSAGYLKPQELIKFGKEALEKKAE